jgi:hypothetical protein
MSGEQAQRNLRPADSTSGRTSSRVYYEKSWAVIIGINNYENYGRLANARNDAETFANLLKEKLGFEEENVFTLLDSNATCDAIRGWLRDELRLKTGKDDRVIFFFAGHGTTEESTKQGYIVPFDAEEGRYSRQIEMIELRQACWGIKAKHILLILDCCFSGIAAIANRGEPQIKAVDDAFLRVATTTDAWQILTAGESDEPVADCGARPGHSEFTAALLDGLGGRADLNGDYLITASDLGNYVKTQVPREMVRYGRSIQKPFFNYLYGSKQGDFVFLLPEYGKEGPADVDRLIAELNNEDSGLRKGAAETIGVIRDNRAIDSLILALNDEDPEVRGEVANALGRIGDVRAVRPLIQKLKDGDRHVRCRAAEALGNIADPEPIPHLINALKNKDSSIRRYAKEALIKIGLPAVDPLIKALKYKNVDAKRNAAEALGKIGDKKAKEPLTEALEGDDLNVKRSIGEALEMLG